MSILSRLNLSSFFGLSDEEDYDYDVKAEAEQSVVGNTLSSPTRPTYSKLKEEQVPKQFDRPIYSGMNTRNETSSKVVNMKSQRQDAKRSTAERKMPTTRGNENSKIMVIEPRVYSEAMSVAKCIMRNESVIVNFSLVEENQARRIVDFLTGTVYAMDGDIQRVGDEIFLCTPRNTEIDSSIAKGIFEEGNQFFN